MDEKETNHLLYGFEPIGCSSINTSIWKGDRVLLVKLNTAGVEDYYPYSYDFNGGYL